MVGIILAGIAWFMRRRTKKSQNGSEPINLSSLQETDENSYQKSDDFSLSQEDASLPGNEESCIVSNL